MNKPFHLAFPVKNLDSTIEFYTKTFGCKIARQSNRWVDFDFYGNQISAHLVEESNESSPTNSVDNCEVPVRHFGAILDMDEWNKMTDHFRSLQLEFVIEPYIRFEGKTGEQGTMFIRDPSGNVLEFKGFKDKSQIFETN